MLTTSLLKKITILPISTSFEITISFRFLLFFLKEKRHTFRNGKIIENSLVWSSFPLSSELLSKKRKKNRRKSG